MPTPSQFPTPDRNARAAFAFDDSDFDDHTLDNASLGKRVVPSTRHSAGATFNLKSDDFDLPPRQEWEIATNFHNKY